MENDKKYLGYINGWSETPEIVKTCREKRKAGEKHEMSDKAVGRCLHEIKCITCGYYYNIDSSG